MRFYQNEQSKANRLPPTPPHHPTPPHPTPPHPTPHPPPFPLGGRRARRIQTWAHPSFGNSWPAAQASNGHPNGDFATDPFGCGSKPFWYHFGLGAQPILCILVGIGGYGLLTHGPCPFTSRTSTKTPWLANGQFNASMMLRSR